MLDPGLAVFCGVFSVGTSTATGLPPQPPERSRKRRWRVSVIPSAQDSLSVRAANVGTLEPVWNLFDLTP